MHLLAVVVLMLILPIGSIAVEYVAAVEAIGLLPLVGKWFVFWASGVRLLLAGLSQIFRPEFTARRIFRIGDVEAQKIVSELGFANVAVGAICVLSFQFPAWVLPAAICSGMFYGLAGAKHVLNQPRTPSENVAMVSDLFVFAVLAVFVVGGALSLSGIDSG